MQRKAIAVMITALFFGSICPGAETGVSEAKNFTELHKMRDSFRKIVGTKIVENGYLAWAVRCSADAISANPEFRQSQYFVYVDRNPARQLIFVCFYDAALKKVEVIGVDKASTGNPNRRGFFETPLGFFKNTPEIMGYRAQGTKNSKGWRGLGARGSRIWDFGWQKTYKNGCPVLIRLLMHATDPDFGEIRLGQVDSKGCIRISAKLNYFLDYFGIIDKEYEERNGVKKIWLLKSDREPVAYAGKYVLVGDSGSF